MELHERISSQRGPIREQEPFAELKNRVHMSVISELGPQLFNIAVDPNELRDRVTADVRRLLNDEPGIAREDRERLTSEILDDILGYGPLERLLADDSITEVMCNGPDDVWIERGGKLYETTVRFTDESHLRRIINKIVSQIGRRIDESSPMVDARLPDGSRVNAIIAPLSLSGPLLTIRKFSRRRLSMEDMINIGSLSEQSVEFLSRCIEAQCNMLISGGTGSGKTTLLNALSASIPNNERIVTIEDAAELSLHQRHVLRLEARPPNIEGEGHIPIRDLVRNSLRMRPDRIIVGEVPRRRGARHAPGDEHGPRRLALDRALELASRRSPPHRDDGDDGRLRPAAAGDPPAHRGRARPPRAHRPHGGRLAARRRHHRGAPHGVGRHPAPGHLRVRDRVGRSRPHDHRRPEATGLRPVFLEKFRKRGIELPQSMFGERVHSLDERRGATA